MSVMASRPPNMPAGAGGSKRPRLSLQTKSSSTATTSNRPASRAFSLNPSDPTAFNTLSNAYVTAIERASTPVTSPVAVAREPLTAINNFQAISLYSPVSARPLPASAYPATPLSAHTSSQPSVRLLPLPSVMSPTPPLSAGAVESSGNSKIFSFSPRDAAAGRHSLEQALHAAAAAAAASSTTTTPSSPMVTPPKQRPSVTRTGPSGSPPPYTHAKALRSILRNSPLPARRPASSPTPHRRFTGPTVRIQVDSALPAQQEQRAAKRVCYHSPIAQEITTNTYTKSHIDLLAEEASTTSPRHHLPNDLSRAFSANEIQDGGQTPGPFEDESRRLGAAMNMSPSDAAKKSATRGEKKRRWVWTIGRDDEDDEEVEDEDEEQRGGAVVAAARAAAAAAAATGEMEAPVVVVRAPLLSVPKPRMKLDTSIAGVEIS